MYVHSTKANGPRKQIIWTVLKHNIRSTNSLYRDQWLDALITSNTGGNKKKKKYKRHVGVPMLIFMVDLHDGVESDIKPAHTSYTYVSVIHFVSVGDQAGLVSDPTHTWTCHENRYRHPYTPFRIFVFLALVLIDMCCTYVAT